MTVEAVVVDGEEVEVEIVMIIHLTEATDRMDNKISIIVNCQFNINIILK